ncbi:hypothetical protein PHLGIDRAFT_123441 [Phlebiopsis gigantea 11061_1 CR5-6]|uniref:Uncharacterized protein n=1 Tax=Phlebiopsis gigantea (strain 11061_1 CR5-6) TaxID=745531 RepID=A0A0C3P9J1_PHLG1|nr:hypothetical protein PHLGIDRAFT_123441 [Phlebiopsis gigantea 11061_1 CR5-6]
MDNAAILRQSSRTRRNPRRDDDPVSYAQYLRDPEVRGGLANSSRQSPDLSDSENMDSDPNWLDEDTNDSVHNNEDSREDSEPIAGEVSDRFNPYIRPDGDSEDEDEVATQALIDAARRHRAEAGWGVPTQCYTSTISQSDHLPSNSPGSAPTGTSEPTTRMVPSAVETEATIHPVSPVMDQAVPVTAAAIEELQPGRSLLLRNSVSAGFIPAGEAPAIGGGETLQRAYLDAHHHAYRRKHEDLAQLAPSHTGQMYTAIFQARNLEELVQDKLKLAFKSRSSTKCRYQGQEFDLSHADVIAWIGFTRHTAADYRTLLNQTRVLAGKLQEHRYPAQFATLSEMVDIALGSMENPLPAYSVVSASSNYSAAQKAILPMSIKAFRGLCTTTTAALNGLPPVPL